MTAAGAEHTIWIALNPIRHANVLYLKAIRLIGGVPLQKERLSFAPVMAIVKHQTLESCFLERHFSSVFQRAAPQRTADAPGVNDLHGQVGFVDHVSATLADSVLPGWRRTTDHGPPAQAGTTPPVEDLRGPRAVGWVISDYEAERD